MRPLGQTSLAVLNLKIIVFFDAANYLVANLTYLHRLDFSAT
jgi:hypothetical protein